MAVKIELESSEIALIRSALGCYREDRQNVIKTGKYKGRKVTASAVSAARNTVKKIETLEDFFGEIR